VFIVFSSPDGRRSVGWSELFLVAPVNVSRTLRDQTKLYKFAPRGDSPAVRVCAAVAKVEHSNGALV